MLGPNFFWGKFPWTKFPLGQISFGQIFLWANLLWVNFHLGQLSSGSIFCWVNCLLGQVSFFWVQQSLGQFTLDQILLGTNYFGFIFFGLIFCWTVLCWVSFPLGQISIGTIFSWVKFPFFGFKCPWVNLPWTKFHLGLIVFGAIFFGSNFWNFDFPWVNLPWTQMLLGQISLVQCGLGQFTLGRTPWAKRLGPFYSAPFYIAGRSAVCLILEVKVVFHLLHIWTFNFPDDTKGQSTFPRRTSSMILFVPISKCQYQGKKLCILFQKEDTCKPDWEMSWNKISVYADVNLIGALHQFHCRWCSHSALPPSQKSSRQRRRIRTETWG